MKHEEIGVKNRMHNKTVLCFLACSLVAPLCVESSALQTTLPESDGVKVVIEKVERVNSNEAHFWLKVVNESAKPVFLEGYPFDMKQMEGLYLEQWRAEEGWTIVVPCRDVFASNAIKLKPGGSMTQERVLELPLSAVCKRQNIHFEGKFRFRLDYFESGNAVRTYIKKMNSMSHEPPHPAYAVSEPFEIPLLKESSMSERSRDDNKLAQGRGKLTGCRPRRHGADRSGARVAQAGAACGNHSLPAQHLGGQTDAGATG
jgi:hypothetical protein